MENFEKIKLENGLRVIFAPEPHNLAATVFILVAAGSKYETKEKNGISHFLEHMCFKGTINRPRAFDISSEFDKIGAQYNAFTGGEYTGYFAKAESRHISKILEIVSDIYLNSIFDEKEIEKEKGVIIEEINHYEDLPSRKVHDLFQELLYGDTPAGWDIAGTKKSVSKIKKSDFIEYRGKNYLAYSTLVVVSGNFDKEKVLGEIKNLFQNIKKGEKTPIAKTLENQKKPNVVLKFKKTDQTHLILGFRAFDYFDSRRFALQILADILGGGMSSRLFQKIREEMGLAYSVSSDANFYSDHGYLDAAIGVQNQKVEEVIKATLNEFKKFKDELVSDEELQISKDHLIGNMILDLETSDEVAAFCGGQEITRGEVKSPEEIIKSVREVSAEDIRNVAKEVIDGKKLNLAIIGPFKNKSKFERILKI